VINDSGVKSDALCVDVLHKSTYDIEILICDFNFW